MNHRSTILKSYWNQIRLYLFIILLAIGMMASGMGCNIFGFIDNPASESDGISDDHQILSAARACFDQGDLECAKEYYKKLSNDMKDEKNSELAFVTLADNGVGMNAFMDVIGNAGSAGGSIITGLADRLAPNANQTVRMNIFGAYQKVANIESPELRGLVRFATSAALAAVMLAEESGTDLTLKREDIVNGATSCFNAKSAGCATASSCDGFSSGSAAFSLDGASASDNLEGEVTLEKIHAAVKALNKALGGDELGAGGKFGSGSADFSALLSGKTTPSTDAAAARCYRYFLLANGIGAE